MQFDIEFNDDIQPNDDYKISINDIDKASYVLPSKEIDVEQSLMMDFIIRPLRNLIEEKKILPGKYQVFCVSSNNHTMFFTVCLKTFDNQSSIKSQVIVTYDSVNISLHKLIGKIRVLYIGKSYLYEIFADNSLTI